MDAPFVGLGPAERLQHRQKPIEMRRGYPAFAFDQFAPYHGDLRHRSAEREEAEPKVMSEERRCPYLRRSNVVAVPIDHVRHKDHTIDVRDQSRLVPDVVAKSTSLGARLKVRSRRTIHVSLLLAVDTSRNGAPAARTAMKAIV